MLRDLLQLAPFMGISIFLLIALASADNGLKPKEWPEGGPDVTKYTYVEENGLTKIGLLPQNPPDNMRNSETDFIQLKDGRILLVYTHFVGGYGDHAGAHLAGRYSDDGGYTWTREDRLVLANEGKMNIMCPSLLRLQNGDIALFYLRKNSGKDCHLYMRKSTDEAQSWSEPTPLHSSGTFYTRCRSHCLELADGGILLATYDMDKGSSRLYGTIHRSDDDGRSWRVISHIRREDQDLDEADWVQLASGRIVLTTRPDGAVFVSDDQGVSWEEIAKVGPDNFYAPSMAKLADDTIVCTVGGAGGQSVLLSSDGGQEWSDAITVDPSVYGYGKVFRDSDESILLSYVQSGRTPNRCWLVRFRVNAQRDGITLLLIAQ